VIRMFDIPIVQTHIKEATYLNTEKTRVYRPIIKYCYTRYLQANRFVYPHEVLEFLQSIGEFSSYTLDEVKRDLESLENWGNLVARQDVRGPEKLEDVLKKRYQYSVSEITVGFEQFLERFDSKRSKITGSTDSSLVSRLLETLYALKDYAIPRNRDMKENQEVYELWSDIFYRFEKLQFDSVSYLSHIDYQKIQAEVAKGELAFLHYKDDFITYLQDFVLSLHRTVDLIISVFKEIEITKLEEVIFAAAEHKCYRDRFIFENVSVEEQIQEFQNSWRYMMQWFSSDSFKHNGGYESLLRQTQETIDQIVKFIRQIGEKYRQVKNRQHEYLHAAVLFEKMNKLDMDECHEMFAYLFGVQNTKHIRAHSISTDQQNNDLWEIEGEKLTLLSKYRERKERKKRKAIQENLEERDRLLKEYEREREIKQQHIVRYLSSKVVRVRDLGPVPACIREEILEWLSRSSFEVSEKGILRYGFTDDGRTFEAIAVTKNRIKLVCNDGTLEMEDLEFRFKEVR